MRKVVRVWLCSILAVAVAAGLTACGGSDGGGAAEAEGEEGAIPEVVRFTDTGTEGMEQLRREFEPFREELEEVLGAEVEFFAVSSRSAAAVALQSDQVDLVLTGPAEYVALRSGADVIPAVGLTRPGYRTVIAGRADRGVEVMEDLQGVTMAMKDVGSTSGHIGPTSILVDSGIDPNEDLEVKMLGDAYVQAYVNGEVDAWGGGLRDWETIQEEYDHENLVLVKEGPDLPNDVFVTNPELGEEFADEVKERFIENQDALIESILVTGDEDMQERYSESEMVEAEDSDYDPIRDAYRSMGIDDFSEAPE